MTLKDHVEIIDNPVVMAIEEKTERYYTADIKVVSVIRRIKKRYRKER